MTDHYIEAVPLNVLAVVPSKPVGRARKRYMDPTKLTFRSLLELQRQRINRGDGISASSLPNLQSALNAFLSQQELSVDSPVGSVFRASYYRRLRVHIESLQNDGRSRDYISNRKGLLAQWRKCVIDFDRYSSVVLKQAHPFQQAIQDVVANVSSQRGLARDSGVSLASLKRWQKGVLPQAGSRGHIAKLERLLGLEAGALLDLLPGQTTHNSERERRSEPKIAYRERLSKASKSPYAVKNANPRLRKEWADFLEYKVSDFNAVESPEDDDGEEHVGLSRSKVGRWSSTKAAVAVPRVSNWFSFFRGKYVATASIMWVVVAQYLGWLMLDEDAGGRGMSAEEAQTLAHLSRRPLVKAYVEWRIERTGGKVHSGIMVFLNFVRSLCNPRTGYLTQSGRHLAGTANDEQENQWRKRCASTFESVRRLSEELSGDLSVSRDPLEPISHVLALANPLDAIADMIARMTVDKPFTNGTREALWARDKLLVKLLASNPLRIKNVRMMTYLSDNKGHLRQDVNGAWFVFVPRRELKNFRGAAKERDYFMPVRREVWTEIEEYLKHYRPMLVKTTTDLLFIAEESGGPFSENGLARRFSILTKKYLHGCPGVGPHSMRHIVATSILKSSPNDWQAAAWALHDREETIRKHYAHLAQHDAALWLNKAFEGPFSRMR